LITARQKRKTATSEFESDLAKLQANATFGKTMQQVRHMVNIRLICDEYKLTKAVSKASFRQSEIINDDLVMVRGAEQTITLNKPISVGFTILEISKLIMYRFFYDYLKLKYGDKCKFLFTDTESLCCHIEKEDLYANMAENVELFDTSNFETTHPLYSLKNHRVLEKFKSERGRWRRLNLWVLGQKCIVSMYQTNKLKFGQKGIKKSYIKNMSAINNFWMSCKLSKLQKVSFEHFGQKNHTVQTAEILKKCLKAFDDKRYILDDGIATLAYGHYQISP